MHQVLRKDFELELLGQTLKYKQLSLYDCIEFTYLLKQKDFKLEYWIYDFLKDKIEVKIEDLLKIDITKFMDVLFDTAFRGFFSKKKGGDGGIPFESYLMFLSEKFNLDPDTLIKKYTPEQINYYIEGIIYNINEQTKEGQRKNKINQAMKEMKEQTDEEQEKKELQELIKRMDNKNNI